MVPDSFPRSQIQCVSVSEYRTFVRNTGQQIDSIMGSLTFIGVGPSNNNDSCSVYDILSLSALCALINETVDLKTASK